MWIHQGYHLGGSFCTVRYISALRLVSANAFFGEFQWGYIFSFYVTCTLETPTSAIMMESLRFIPPLRDSGNALRFSSRLNVDSIRLISFRHIFRGTPLIWKEEASLHGASNFIPRNTSHWFFSYIICTRSFPLCFCLCLEEKSWKIFELSKNPDTDSRQSILRTWIEWLTTQ